jgi:hypothetical protein
VSVVERVYQNEWSGESCRFSGVSDANSRRMSAFRGRMAGLLRWAQVNKCMVYFLTLTVGNVGTMNVLMLNGLMSFMRWRFKAKGMPFRYVWVLEPQMQRYEETGIMAPHWHIAIACPFGALPNVEFREKAPPGQKYHLVSDGTVVKQRELYERWGHGQTLCAFARRDPMGYMAKYMEKALEEVGLWGHRFGSAVMGWWKIAKWAFEVLLLFWSSESDILRVWFSRGIDRRILNFTCTDGAVMERYSFPSPWVRLST